MEQSFAEKLKIQATDKRVAILEEFIDGVARSTKIWAERAADEGKFSCSFETGTIPDILMPAIYSKRTIEPAVEDIIVAIKKKLDNCGFTKLDMYRNPCGYGSSGRTLKVICAWN